MIKQFLDKCPGIGRASKDIYEFLDSGHKCCEIDTTGYKDAGSARATYEVYLRRNNVKDVRAVIRSSRLYLVREDQQ